MRKRLTVLAMHGDIPPGANTGKYRPVEQAPNPGKLRGAKQQESPAMKSPEAYKKARKGKTDS